MEQLRLQANALVRKIVAGGSVIVEGRPSVYDPSAGVYATRNVYGSPAPVYVGNSSTTASGHAVAEGDVLKANALLKADVKHMKRRVSSLSAIVDRWGLLY